MAVIGETNITMSTIRDVLNGAGGSVGNDLTTFFSANAKLNKWSKYKPVIHPDFLFYDLSTWKGSGYKGKDLHCGLAINTFRPSEFKSSVNTNKMNWGYNIPYGTSAAPMRLGDFRGYCTDAYNPIGNIVTNGLIVSGNVSFAIDVAITGSSSTNLTLNDIIINGVSLTNYYLGVYLWSSFASRFYTSSNKIGSGTNLNVTIPLGGALGGSYQYIPFLSNVPQITGADVADSTIISCNIAPKSVELTPAADMRVVLASGSWNPSETSVIAITAFLSNNTSSSVTFTNIRVQLRRSTGTSSANSELVASVSYSGSVSVAADGNSFVDMPNIVHKRAGGYNYWLAAYADQSTKITYNQIEEYEKS